MLRDITLGQFYPADSVLHRLIRGQNFWEQWRLSFPCLYSTHFPDTQWQRCFLED